MMSPSGWLLQIVTLTLGLMSLMNSAATIDNQTALQLPVAELMQEGLVDWCFMLSEPVRSSSFVLPSALVGNMVNGSEEACSNSDTSMGRLRAVTQLVDCINSKYEYKSMTWQQYLSGAVKSVRVYGSFSFSSEDKRPYQATVPLTVIVGATVSRLGQLYAQCQSWAGPLSAVLLQPLMQPAGGLTPANQDIMHMAARLVRKFVHDMHKTKGACQPDVLLVYEIYQDETSYKLLYPYNILRNLARLQARTPLIAMIDVDMLISTSLYTLLSDTKTSEQIMTQARQRNVMLIPAFNVRGQHEKAAWADALTSEFGDKEFLLSILQQGTVYQFGGDHYSVGHGLINYTRWINADQNYLVDYEFLCEPWFIGDRMALPWYDVRYRGYGFDKVQQILHAFALDFEFRVLNNAFIIHRDHRISNASLTFKGSFTNPNKTSAGYLLKELVHSLFKEQVKKHLLGTEFHPVLDASTQHCQTSLTWWNTSMHAGSKKSVSSTYESNVNAIGGSRPAARFIDVFE